MMIENSINFKIQEIGIFSFFQSRKNKMRLVSDITVFPVFYTNVKNVVLFLFYIQRQKDVIFTNYFEFDLRILSCCLDEARNA